MTRLWLPPGTASTWICRCGAVNPRTTTICRKCTNKEAKQ